MNAKDSEDNQEKLKRKSSALCSPTKLKKFFGFNDVGREL
jgi:hypothetical protein